METSGQTGIEKDPYRQEERILAGRRILFDAEGFFWDPRQWNEEVAEILGQEAGLSEFNETQWRIIRFFRRYYFENGRSPLNRQIKQETGINLIDLEALFPGGIKYGARRLAGLPNPKNCA